MIARVTGLSDMNLRSQTPCCDRHWYIREPSLLRTALSSKLILVGINVWYFSYNWWRRDMRGKSFTGRKTKFLQIELDLQDKLRISYLKPLSTKLTTKAIFLYRPMTFLHLKNMWRFFKISFSTLTSWNFQRYLTAKYACIIFYLDFSDLSKIQKEFVNAIIFIDCS